MTQALTSIVSCEMLGLAHPFCGVMLGACYLKCCQYATNDFKVCVGLTIISIKETQFIL